ncbi:hypothetical protein DRO41_03370 [Candidatus Bathyarchaeota archaeon]|nr:MAG: hypothetical protein DRO41_03370 [Candidatus Bathyarchaeota archaeon]
MSEWDKKRDLMQRYNLTAHLYDMRYAEEQNVKFDVALKNVTVEDGLILDVGCGTGLLFNRIAEKTETVVGLDFSKKLLFEAKKRGRKLRNVHLVLADADNMPFKEDVFDRVFAFTVVQNTPNPAETLREIKRVAKNDAVVAVTGLKRVFNLEEFKRLLCGAGLEIVNLESDGEKLKCHMAVCRISYVKPS